MVDRVTVLMGVYDSPVGMLNEAIDSILAQTYHDFEFLIVDDGSKSEAVRSLLQARERGDSRIRVLWQPHRGLTAALNCGISAARGEYIARQDADDWSQPNRLSRQIAWLDAHPEVAACGSNAWTHQEDGTALWRTNLPCSPEHVLQAFPRGNPLVHGSTMFHRQAAVDLGGYCESFRCSQDYDFFWRLAERYGAANLQEPLYHYRYTSGSISAGRALEQLRAHHAIRRLAVARASGEPLEPEAALAQADAELQQDSGVFRALLKQADHRMLAGDYRGAASSYLELLRGHAASALAWGKLARLGLFWSMPFLREASFR